MGNSPVPNRIIREGILSSDRVEQLDPPAEVFYRRLMSKVDDHGLYDARPSILRTSLYPLRVDRVREADIARWIAACEKAGVIALYQHDGKPYLQMLDTRWQARSEPKYPQPTANGCAQLPAPALVVGVVGVVEDGGVPRKRAASSVVKKSPIAEDFAASDAVKAWAQENGYDRLGEHLQAFARKCKAKSYAYADWDAAFMEAIREDWAKLRGRAPNGAAPPPTIQTTPTTGALARLAADRMTPEQFAASEAARQEFNAKRKGIAA